ncbi:hypothetical protein BG004_004485 [Podila humilis]|nr:hypothetical protein BG004_004485 [Podila humilis]
MPSLIHSRHQKTLATIAFFFALCVDSSSAALTCISPTSLSDGLRAGADLTLGFSDNAILGDISSVSAQLICSANGSVALTLGSGYTSFNFAPNSPVIRITEAQVATATKDCPSKIFHVQYVATGLNRQVVECSENLTVRPVVIAAAPEDSHVIIAAELPFTAGAVEVTQEPTPAPATSDVTPPSPTPIVPSPSSTPPPTTSSDVVAPPTTALPPPPPVTTTSPPDTSETSSTKTKTTKSTRPTNSRGGGNGNGNGSGNGNGNGNGNGSDNGNGSGNKPSSPVTSTKPNDPDQTNDASGLRHEASSSMSTSTIAGACAGVVGGVCAILAGLLIWRKRQQKRMKFDEFYDNSLAAASGFKSKPIFGRENPDEEDVDSSGLGVGAVVPLTQAHARSLSTKSAGGRDGASNGLSPPPPPPLMPVSPTPVYESAAYHQRDYEQEAGGQDYYNENYLNYQPYQQPYQDAYNQNAQEYYEYSYEMQPTEDVVEHGRRQQGHEGEAVVGYYPGQAAYGREYEYDQQHHQQQQHQQQHGPAQGQSGTS